MMRIWVILVCFCLGYGATAQVTANPPEPLRLCDDLASGSEFDEISVFNLTVVEPEVIGAQDPSNLEVSYFLTEVDAVNNVNPIFDPTAYLNVVNPQSVFIRLTDFVTTEFDVTTVTLIVYPLPTPVSPTPLEACDDDDDGIALFDLHLKDDEILGGMTDAEVSYYETLADAESGNVGLALTSPYFNIVPFNQTLYVRVAFDVPPAPLPCYEIVELELIAYIDCPVIDAEPEDLIIIEGDGDGLAIFDLTINEALILGSQDPLLFAFSYHESSEAATNGTDAIPNPEAYQNIANPQVIYVRLTNVNNGTFIVTDFVIETDGVLNVNDFLDISFGISPNPASEYISIHGLNANKNYKVGIYDITGKLIHEVVGFPDAVNVLDVSALSPQLYLLKISDGKNTKVARFIRR